jgi:hypothetical protein
VVEEQKEEKPKAFNILLCWEVFKNISIIPLMAFVGQTNIFKFSVFPVFLGYYVTGEADEFQVEGCFGLKQYEGFHIGSYRVRLRGFKFRIGLQEPVNEGKLIMI